jgi:putative membrane protein
MNPPLSDADRARIGAAVAAAERATSGEIFTVVTAAADDYRFIPLLWATLAALAVPLPLIVLTDWPAMVIFIAQLVVFLVLAAAMSLPAVRPRAVPASVRRTRAHALAVQQFMAHGLTTTEARTGVLIFVALAERYAEIIADTAIAGKVDQAVWDDAIARLTAEIGAGRLADGLVGTVETVGGVLARHFPPRSGDRDELPNDLVIL